MPPDLTAGRLLRLSKSCRVHKNHHQKIERIAVIATHDWQHWVISAVRMFLHPEVRADDKSQEAEALQWIVG